MPEIAMLSRSPWLASALLVLCLVDAGAARGPRDSSPGPRQLGVAATRTPPHASAGPLVLPAPPILAQFRLRRAFKPRPTISKLVPYDAAGGRDSSWRGGTRPRAADGAILWTSILIMVSGVVIAVRRARARRMSIAGPPPHEASPPGLPLEDDAEDPPRRTP